MTIEAVNVKPWTLRHGLGTGPLPTSGYTSQKYYQREVEQIWNRTWIRVGKLHTIPNPGDYFVKELPWANTSVIVARGKDEQVRAFHNVCAHRCNRLVPDDCGSARMFHCSFHGWVYGLDGSLINVPDEQGFFDFDKSAYRLASVAVDTWEDFIFINLASDPPETLQEYLGPFYDELHGFPFHEYTHDYIWSAELNCNWKLAREAFIETYHVPVVHKKSFAPSFSSKSNPFSHNLSFATSKYHCQMSTYMNPDYQPTPMEMLAFVVGGGLSVNDKRGAEMPVGVNPTRDPCWSNDVDIIFPSVTLDPFANFYLELHWWPVAVDRCRFEIRHCVRPPVSHSQRWVHEVANATLHAGVLEDLRTLEPMQRSVESGAIRTMPLHDEEFMIRFCSTVNQQLAGPYPEV
jgi:Rieske 2Fe-2S family protein